MKSWFLRFIKKAAVKKAMPITVAFKNLIIDLFNYNLKYNRRAHAGQPKYSSAANRVPVKRNMYAGKFACEVYNCNCRKP